MDIQTVLAIFTDELQGKAEGTRITLPHGTRVTVFIGTPGGVIPIPKVDSVTLAESYVVFGSDEGRVFSSKGDILAIRADQEAHSRKEGKVGFG